jgi:hypothetical protein
MTMDAQRFEALAGAYGADFRRWPEAERQAAQAFAQANRMQSERLLFEARMIDAALEAAGSAAPSMALRDQVIALAPKARPPRVRAGAWFWVPGAGVAAACAAGALFGMVAMERASAASNADTVLASNADNNWSDTDLTEIL